MKKFGLICVLSIAAMGVYAETRFYLDANIGIESIALYGERDMDIIGFTTDASMGTVFLPKIGIGVAGLFGISVYSDTSPSADAFLETEELTRYRFGAKAFYAPLRTLQLFAAPYYLIANGDVASNETSTTKGFGFDTGISFFPIGKYACSPTLNAAYRFNVFGDLYSHSAVFTVGFVKR
jgi:hypothetical protein